jgi:hypothetical protein
MTVANQIRAMAKAVSVRNAPPVAPAALLQAGSPAPAIDGIAPDGTPATADTADNPTRLIFLTSDCKECRDVWKLLPERGYAGRVVLVITPGPETDSRKRVSELSARAGQSPPADIEPLRVIMSSRAWHDFGVTKAPWLVDVDNGLVAATRPFT